MIEILIGIAGLLCMAALLYRASLHADRAETALRSIRAVVDEVWRRIDGDDKTKTIKAARKVS